MDAGKQPTPTPEHADDGWIDWSVAESLNLERAMAPVESSAALAQRLIEERAPQAVLVISKLADASDSDKVRLDAAKYILDRVLGPPRSNNVLKDEIQEHQRRIDIGVADKIGEAMHMLLIELGLDPMNVDVRNAAYRTLAGVTEEALEPIKTPAGKKPPAPPRGQNLP